MLGCLAVHHRNIRLGGLLGLVVDQGVAAAIAGLHRLVVGFKSAEQNLHQRGDVCAPLDIYGLDDALKGNVAVSQGIQKSLLDLFQQGVIARVGVALDTRSEEHTSELQSLMRISYAVFCLKKKKTTTQIRSN